MATREKVNELMAREYSYLRMDRGDGRTGGGTLILEITRSRKAIN